MAWRFVRQPSGKLARFSEIVDDFTDYDLTEEEAFALCREYNLHDAEESRAKVKRGMDDLPLFRWKEALEVILHQHGWKVCLARMIELGGLEAAVLAAGLLDKEE